MNFHIIILLLTAIWNDDADAKTSCPTIPNVLGDSFNRFWHDAEAILNFTKYDTNQMTFYVMSPNSYPNFEKPDGGDVVWSTLDCKDKKILFNCHGFREKGLQVWAIDLIRTYVQQYGGCGVAIDYEGASENLNYISVISANTGNIAARIAGYIADNICNGTNCTEHLQLHGHSWGAHTCGIAGYLLGQKDPSFKPARMFASDAAGPYFNTMAISNPSYHMSRESAISVINIKTSQFDGSSRLEWADQTQYIGNCGTNQAQCEGRSTIMDGELCDHQTSVFVTKSTMMKSFPKVNVTKCSSCLSWPVEDCTDEHDYLGWQSKGKPGLFIIKHLPFCLSVTLDSAL